MSSPKVLVYLAIPETGHIAPVLPFLRYLIETDPNVQIVIMGTPFIEPLMSSFPPHRAALHLYTDLTGKPFDPFIVDDLTNPAKLIFSHYPTFYQALFKQLQNLQTSLLLFDTFQVFGAALAHDLAIPSISLFTHPVAPEEPIRPWGPVFVEGIESIYHSFMNDHSYLKATITGPHLIFMRNLGTLQFIFSVPELHPPLSLAIADLPPAKQATFHFVGPIGIKKDTRLLPIDKKPLPPSSSPLPKQNLNRSLTDDLPWDFLDANKDKKLIFVSMGTVTPAAKKVFLLVLNTLRSFPNALVVMAVGNSISSFEELGHLPNHFIIRKFVRQLLLLPRASLFVTHGGYNSFNEGAYYGVPLIVFPHFGDQIGNALTAEAAGVGIAMTNLAQNDEEGKFSPSPSTQWDEKQFEAAVETILIKEEEKYKRTCTALQVKVRESVEDGIVKAASLVHDLLRGHKSLL